MLPSLPVVLEAQALAGQDRNTLHLVVVPVFGEDLVFSPGPMLGLLAQRKNAGLHIKIEPDPVPLETADARDRPEPAEFLCFFGHEKTRPGYGPAYENLCIGDITGD